VKETAMARMKLGLIVGLSENVEEGFKKVADVGVPTCQLSCVAESLVGHPDPAEVRQVADQIGVEISSVFLLFAGQRFDRFTGPPTMGLVPEALRAERLALSKDFSDHVAAMGVSSITCHMGFIPDDPGDPEYPGFIDATKELIAHCAKNGQDFCFETGQELPSTLKRTLRDVDMPNAAVNLDPGNLILYGMAHPLDAVEIFGEDVRGFHAKDGRWPNRDEALGIEVRLGDGEVNFPLVLTELKKKGFRGPITIEREISGPQQRVDILYAKEFLEPYLELEE
jgi:L-ribulose-5-phosphate 3-epimerase